MTQNFLVLVLAFLLDRIAGDPPWLWKRVPHPVTIFGKAIAFLDATLNGRQLSAFARRLNGVLAILVLAAASVTAGLLVQRLLDLTGPFGLFVKAIVVAVFLAQKSLSDHVADVAGSLRAGGLEGGRSAVSKIVGRDPDTLDEPAVCRAAIESLAENFSDGVVAPALWYGLFGLPGLLAYKMLNTADSMIGHRSETYLEFGWAAARLDDLANWPAARLSLLLIAAGAFIRRGAPAARAALGVGLRDNGMHRSPNSGWPEAAMAGALGVQLAGPRVYAGTRVNEPMINRAGRAPATPQDIDEGIVVFNAACSVTLSFAFILFLLLF